MDGVGITDVMYRKFACVKFFGIVHRMPTIRMPYMAVGMRIMPVVAVIVPIVLRERGNR